MLFGGALAFRAGRKVYSEMKEKMNEDPARPLAVAVVEVSPDVEWVSDDPSHGGMVLRVLETGERVEATYEEVVAGRFAFVNGEGETITLGAEAVTPPSWVPVYPNVAEAGISVQRSTRTGTEGVFILTTHDTLEMAKAFYESSAPWAQSSSVSSYALGTSGSFSHSWSGSGRQLEVDATQKSGGALQVMVRYQD